ncbi:hypothetical protein BBI17_001678 [Phytophthora kernoviae]|nr:hypothetical protein BBI17_001678 [Phytophthora kernoviae]
MVALVVSNDNFAVAGSSTATTAKPEEVYAAVFRVKDGKVTDATLKDINQNDGSVYYLNQDDGSDYYLNQDDSTEEERAAVHFPKFMTSGPLHWIFKKLGNLLLKVKKHTKHASSRR